MGDSKKNHSSQQSHVVFLGEAGFPLGFGSIQRMTLMAKALIHDGCQATVICRKGVWRQDKKMNFPTTGNFEGIDYLYTSKTIFRPENFFYRNIQKLKGMYGEFRYLKNLKRNGRLDVSIISNMSALHVLRYRIYSRLIGFPIILNFVELASSMKDRNSLLLKINDHIYDNYIIRIVDGAMPISNKLMEYYKSLSPSKPLLKLPILCDFGKFDSEAKNKNDITFLYCGAASYMELIEFVLSAFDQLGNLKENVFLKLILGCEEGELEKVEQKIAQSNNKDHIELITNVPHKEIPLHYSNAAALLIPLRPTVQDEARFPHKIGEYLASGRPMITTCYGEIKNYDFKDEENSLIADKYNETSFAEKMNYVLENPLKAKEIGQRGRHMGIDNFDYTKYGETMNNYFLKIGANKR